MSALDLVSAYIPLIETVRQRDEYYNAPVAASM